MSKLIACLGDPSDHGGQITFSPPVRCVVSGVPVAVLGATHTCPIPFHGVTPVIPITIRTFVEGKLVITAGAKAGCGATIIPIPRRVMVE
jgi:uncharacterized Zn-binding protein involved in type VI secretion